MKTIQTRTWKSPVGELLLGSWNGELCLCDWKYRTKRVSIDQRLQSKLGCNMVEEGANDPVHAATIDWLESYFSGMQPPRYKLPVRMAGSAFQIRVWEELEKISYGEKISYRELALRIGKPSAVRAVANANGANAISIIIPCHRVIGDNGNLTGYAGGLAVKKKLLQVEQVDYRNSQMDFFIAEA